MKALIALVLFAGLVSAAIIPQDTRTAWDIATETNRYVITVSGVTPSGYVVWGLERHCFFPGFYYFTAHKLEGLNET